MKRSILTFLVSIVITSISIGQQKAITDTGEEVLLHSDGTWQYINEKPEEVLEIKTNPKKFKKPKDANFLLKSSNFNIGFWINTNEWKFSKPTQNSDAEYELELKSGDLYGMIISEKVEIPVETLRGIALDNARSEAPDIRVTKEEYRNVNGVQVLLLRMDGTMLGIKFAYYGYYFSNENGTVQFITYTSQNLIDSFSDKIEDLLNGFVEL